MVRQRAEQVTSAGGVVYRMENGSPLVLLIRDSYGNWGFPKGRVERGEQPADSAQREVREETGIADSTLRGEIEVIDWWFRWQGRLIHKFCHFFLIETQQSDTTPQREEGITECRWATFDDAITDISYTNARAVLHRARDMVGVSPS